MSDVNKYTRQLCGMISTLRLMIQEAQGDQSLSVIEREDLSWILAKLKYAITDMVTHCLHLNRREMECDECEFFHQNDPDYPNNCEFPDNPPCDEP